MNFAAHEENRVTATVIRGYNFESDEEDNINTDDLSDLSDVFEETPRQLSLGARNNANDSAQTISLDDVTYDRDLKYINVPNGARSKHVILQPSRFLKQVQNITNEASAELEHLDRHYAEMDTRKRDHEKKFLVEFDTDHSGKGRDARRRGTRGRSRRGSGERREATGKSGMEEENGVVGVDRDFDVDIAGQEVRSSRRRGQGRGGDRDPHSERGDRGDRGDRGGPPRDKNEVSGRGRHDNRGAAKSIKSDPRARQDGKAGGRHAEPRSAPSHETAPEYTLHEPAYRQQQAEPEREYADFVPAQQLEYNGNGESFRQRGGRGYPSDRVHPRAVVYQHPNSSNLPLESHHTARRGGRPSGGRVPLSPHYAYDAQFTFGAAPVGAEYYQDVNAPTYSPYGAYQEQAYPQEPLYIPNRYNARTHAPPLPSANNEPKLNAKAAEFVPNFPLTG